ncbi:hypothetical protein NEMBOFW57_010181 [Staphylotrichum longicolle]|uniref:L domain-like protein n=1 Tax=Staphylotrichum longicolle TaxID=669026 RepID=A0AAD4EQA8_9PEZI|nr:hypothetical protein NEMBOFW57_010181 [Staphylotrichum longicolle]
MTHNQLSSLTAWNHLMNLQYIDISNNSLTSLAAFKSLIHLRSLKVDNNQITSLDGIKFHKGLQTLRARGNLIEQVDLDGATLHQLTTLDLKSNAITHVANIAHLPALSTLNLENNALTTFALDAPLPTLRYLHLNNNALTALSLHNAPHLHPRPRARHRIDSLSLRDQRGDAPLDVPHLLSRAYEVRKLYLSGNFLADGFHPRIDLLNLQLLELANCGLSSLPPDVGLTMPNLRVLNLNMNALSDLAPLAAVPRLKRVLVAGNRLADPAALVGVLSGWGCLSALDVRDNPVTQGFYAPVGVVVGGAAAGVVALRNNKGRDGEGDGEGEGEDEAGMFVLGDQDAERDARYSARLDMDTRVRRRLWETMVGKRCARVRKLDGLSVAGRKRKEVEGIEGGDGQEEKDLVWVAMAEKGLVKRKGDEKNVVEGGGGEEQQSSQ